jgi:hypothetical protein
VADLLPVSLVEMLAEMERDLLARKRTYHNKNFTRRITHERSERRLVVVQAIIDLIRDQLPPGQLEAYALAKEKAKKKRIPRKAALPGPSQPAKMM